MSLGSMSHVDFKKKLCRHVEFRGQGPSSGPRDLEKDCSEGKRVGWGFEVEMGGGC